MHKREFHFTIQGEIMSQETLNFSLSVNPSSQNALVVVDANGNPLADGATVQLQAETVGVADPGQVLFKVSGGTAPYNFSVASGAAPSGDQLSSVVNADGSETVSLAGTPTVAGAVNFAILVSDSATPVAAVRKIGVKN